MKLAILLGAAAVVLTGCATSPKSFYANPAKAKNVSLCRALTETADPVFANDVATEIVRRGITADECSRMITQENSIVAAIAIVGGAAAIAGASAGGRGIGGGGGYSKNNDVDCRGGSGDGPYYQDGPIFVGSYDPNGLDANKNGTGCEASDRYLGS